MLTVATFVALLLLPQVAPALKDYQSLDPRSIASILALPVPKPKPEPPAVLVKETKAKLPENLSDPTHALDHFYDALLKNGTVRILHYGDSPTTGDLITADARRCCKRNSATRGRALFSSPVRGRGTTIAAWRWTLRRIGRSILRESRRRRTGCTGLAA